MKILLVEDDGVVQALQKALLDDTGHDVTSVGTGSEALEQLASEAYDALILDVVLVGLTGFDVLERAGHLPNKVVVLTALSTHELTGLLPPNIKVLTKPASTEEILGALE